MKIKIKLEPGVGKEHGITVDRIFEVFDFDDDRGLVVVEGDADELIHLYPREYDILKGSIEDFDDV